MMPEFSTEIVGYDAIVVGAGYGGLITGAILSRNGLKILVVDGLEQIGGRLGCVSYNGYWLDWGPRDAKDFCDNFIVVTELGQYGKKAAEAAGADIAWVGPIVPNVLVHRMTDGKLIPWSGEPDAMIRFATDALDLSADQAKKFLSILGELAEKDPRKWMGVTLGEWLPTIKDKELHQAFQRIAQLTFALPLERSSVGRWIELLRNPLQTYKINDSEVGSQQGLMEPYARVIRKYGGDIKLGLQTVEISVEENGVKGIVARDKTNTVQEFHAPVVVFNDPIWEVFKVLDESHFPLEISENARKLEQWFKGDLMVLNVGVSRVPIIKASGKADDYMGFNQFLEVESGWYIPTLSSEKQAPQGKHLLSIVTGAPEYLTFKEGKARLNTVFEYMRQYYSDLDQITEWVSCQWQKVWGTTSCWSSTPRSPLEVGGLGGLYFVGTTVEVDGLYQDIDANSALQAAQMILQRQGK